MILSYHLLERLLRDSLATPLAAGPAGPSERPHSPRPDRLSEEGQRGPWNRLPGPSAGSPGPKRAAETRWAAAPGPRVSLPGQHSQPGNSTWSGALTVV
jgi:hypothetical protein